MSLTTSVIEQEKAAEHFRDTFGKIQAEISKFIVGQEDIIENVLISIVAGGHVPLEGVPGLGKTALVNTIALTLFQMDSAAANLVLLCVLVLVALIAVIIDRRSFLIAAVGYCVALSFTVFDENGAGYTILALGVALVSLGAAWEWLRARLLGVFAPILPLDRLPPSA